MSYIEYLQIYRENIDLSMKNNYVKNILICIYLAISLSLGQMPCLSQIPAPPPPAKVLVKCTSIDWGEEELETLVID